MQDFFAVSTKKLPRGVALRAPTFAKVRANNARELDFFVYCTVLYSDPVRSRTRVPHLPSGRVRFGYGLQFPDVMLCRVP
jgi:hypothetical protein